MHGIIHRDMAYQVIEDFSKDVVLEYLLLCMVRPDWPASKRTQENRIEWLKEWMDTPDDAKHGSTCRNDHSYKLKKEGSRYKLVFGGGTGEQATVVARLKYDARDLREWRVEEEPRVCGLELAICMHWVIDMSSPPHMYADCDQKVHYKIEDHFDKVWNANYAQIKPQIDFSGVTPITDVYNWARHHIESRYDQNDELITAYKDKKTLLKDDRCKELALCVIKDIAQNIIDFLVFAKTQVNGFDYIYDMLQKQVALYK